jgi:hypothetical protein
MSNRCATRGDGFHSLVGFSRFKRRRRREGSMTVFNLGDNLVTSMEALERLYAAPGWAALAKETNRIIAPYRAFIEAAPTIPGAKRLTFLSVKTVAMARRCNCHCGCSAVSRPLLRTASIRF